MEDFMQKEILIQKEESDSIQVLFGRYNAYLNILGYLMSKYNLNEDNNKIFNEKFEETIQLSIDLEDLKIKISNKYRPEGVWKKYEFNFINNSIIFYND